MQYIQVEQLLQNKVKHVGKVAVGADYDVMNIQLKTGEMVAEHSAPGEVLIVCRKGRVKFYVEGQVTELDANALLMLEPNEKHSLEAVEDCEIIVVRIKK
ncbi:cupin domain-containing protein [Bacillus ndiopicus]|uniref:cupin domain-containing protein n=1 Tax=Bacillus ndiopicus TaxID=1347368 RepID=UPI0005A74D44|nr:cupin domain-containing protein [Bacillus ndiopicus]